MDVANHLPSKYLLYYGPQWCTGENLQHHLNYGQFLSWNMDLEYIKSAGDKLLLEQVQRGQEFLSQSIAGSIALFTVDDVEDIQALEIYCAQVGLIDAYVAGQKPINDPSIKLYDQGQTCVYDIAPVLDHAGMQKVADTLAPWLRDMNDKTKV